MLLVAMPKTASTSVLDSLGKMSELPAEQMFFQSNPWPNRSLWQVLPRLHSDARELTPYLAQRLLSIQMIFKQHILPTASNLELLQGAPVVLLRREPAEIVLAYRRSDLLLGIKRPDFAGLTTEEQWLTRASEVGLIEELERFEAQWRARGATTIFSFQDVTMQDPSQVLGAMLKVWGIPIRTEHHELSRMRYSRGTVSDYRVPGTTANSARIKARIAIKKAFEKLGYEVKRTSTRTENH